MGMLLTCASWRQASSAFLSSDGPRYSLYFSGSSNEGSSTSIAAAPEGCRDSGANLSPPVVAAVPAPSPSAGWSSAAAAAASLAALSSSCFLLSSSRRLRFSSLSASCRQKAKHEAKCAGSCQDTFCLASSACIGLRPAAQVRKLNQYVESTLVHKRRLAHLQLLELLPFLSQLPPYFLLCIQHLIQAPCRTSRRRSRTKAQQEAQPETQKQCGPAIRHI